MIFGSLASPDVIAGLEKAQKKPEAWTVYLVASWGEQRTLAQNKMFRRLLAKLAQQNGHSVKYWHDSLVERFLGYEEVATEDGCIRRVLPSTADLTVAEFSSFLSACLVVANELNVQL